MARTFIVWGAVFGFLAVALGAFGGAGRRWRLGHFGRNVELLCHPELARILRRSDDKRGLSFRPKARPCRAEVEEPDRSWPVLVNMRSQCQVPRLSRQVGTARD